MGATVIKVFNEDSVKGLTEYKSNEEALGIFVPKEFVEAFKQLVQRATNTWPDAPPEIKEFADMICEGKVLQDYYSQNKDQHTRKHLEEVNKLTELKPLPEAATKYAGFKIEVDPNLKPDEFYIKT